MERLESNQESTIYNQCILWAPLANTWSLCSLKFLYTSYFAVNLLTPRSNLSFSLLPPHNSYNVSSESLVLDQLIIPKLIFSLFSSLIWLIFYWYCEEKFCLGHSWALKGWRHVHAGLWKLRTYLEMRSKMFIGRYTMQNLK